MGSKETINESMKMILKDKSLSLSMMREKVKQRKPIKVKHIDEMADRLVRIYGAEGSRQFFLKCYWHLDERFVENVVEMSKRTHIRKPLKYFVASCHNEMTKLGV